MNIEIKNDNTGKVLSELNTTTYKALMTIGILMEKYAKALCPVGTVESTGKKGYRGGTLRNSITYKVEDKSVILGSNVEYAPYVELGTGPHFTPPPEWEKFTTKKGAGLKKGGYVKPRPYLRPAIVDHIDEYKNIVIKELKT